MTDFIVGSLIHLKLDEQEQARHWYFVLKLKTRSVGLTKLRRYIISLVNCVFIVVRNNNMFISLLSSHDASIVCIDVSGLVLRELCFEEL